MRVVLGTQVVLSALLATTPQALRIREAWQQKRIVPLISTETAHELIRTLAYPRFGLEPRYQQELLADYLPYCEVVGPVIPSGKLPLCRDPDDTKFLELADAGGAELLVSDAPALREIAPDLTLRLIASADFAP